MVQMRRALISQASFSCNASMVALNSLEHDFLKCLVRRLSNLFQAVMDFFGQMQGYSWCRHTIDLSINCLRCRQPADWLGILPDFCRPSLCGIHQNGVVVTVPKAVECTPTLPYILHLHRPAL